MDFFVNGRGWCVRHDPQAKPQAPIIRKSQAPIFRKRQASRASSGKHQAPSSKLQAPSLKRQAP